MMKKTEWKKGLTIMDFPKIFIAAGEAYCTLDEHVPAPYLRKSFRLDAKPERAELLICGLGFYTLYVNGTDVTKGPLAPYISAPNDLIYFDRYDLADVLQEGGKRHCRLPGKWIAKLFWRLCVEFRESPLARRAEGRPGAGGCRGRRDVHSPVG